AYSAPVPQPTPTPTPAPAHAPVQAPMQAQASLSRAASAVTRPAAVSMPVRASAPVPSSPAPKRKAYRLVAIGTSTGGPVALQRVLTQLPANFPAPMVLIQHMPAAF